MQRVNQLLEEAEIIGEDSPGHNAIKETRELSDSDDDD